MALSKPFAAPNGAAVTYHRVIKAEISATGTEITVQSWPDEAAFLAGRPPLWNSRIKDESAQNILPDLEANLILGAGDFGGATMLVDSGTDVEQARHRRWAAIKAQRESLDNQPIEHADFRIDADATSRVDIMGAVMAMQMGGGASRPWRCSDNVMRELTLDDLVQIGQAIAARRQALIETSDALYQQLQAAGTAEAVAAVVWPA